MDVRAGLMNKLRKFSIIVAWSILSFNVLHSLLMINCFSARAYDSRLVPFNNYNAGRFCLPVDRS